MTCPLFNENVSIKFGVSSLPGCGNQTARGKVLQVHAGYCIVVRASRWVLASHVFVYLQVSSKDRLCIYGPVLCGF
jgi:hypothetical protein